MFPSSLMSMVSAPPAPPKPYTVAPGTGQSASSTPPPPSQNTAYGPVNARQEARVGDQDVSISYSATDFGGLAGVALILGLLGLVGLLVLWLL